MPTPVIPFSIVLTTAPDQATAEKIADGVITNRLAACVNIVPKVASRYMWEGKLEKNEELLLIIKTRTSLVPNLARYIKENNTYKLSECVAMSVTDGDPSYFDWLGANTQFSGAKPAGLS